MVSFWGEGGVAQRGGDEIDYSGQQGQVEGQLEGLHGATRGLAQVTGST